MAFLKRLGFYLFGLSIGLIFLSIFLRKKSEATGVEFCYFPNCRTLKDIRSKPLTYSGDIRAMMDNEQLDSLMISYFLTDGKVDFKNSDTKSKPCRTYIIEADVNKKKAVMTVRNCPDSSLIDKVKF
ncbi:DUF4258 domain-containing protein [Maribacter arenosus]|uniref:DUF4258 domain-containing protein n=1 Tax=Maribacter arenosus TaxID=1854708 RepID=A0ABR7V6W0_9FLAO|nr:DUF4258 domain-containing protein [Maribacter arenosus]MBD0849410.1 DUF4258 domain-containing protein [Maribacter arenosus]